MTLLTWLKTRVFSSVDEQTIEKVPARSPYRPRFSSVSFVLTDESVRAATYLCERLAQQDLVPLLDEVSRSEGVSIEVT
jgi:hypothetical protein